MKPPCAPHGEYRAKTAPILPVYEARGIVRG
jgi:hypothetical protein